LVLGFWFWVFGSWFFVLGFGSRFLVVGLVSAFWFLIKFRLGLLDQIKISLQGRPRPNHPSMFYLTVVGVLAARAAACRDNCLGSRATQSQSLAPVS